MLKAVVTTCALSVLLLQRAPAARACGAFFPSESAQNLAIGAQRALLVVAEDTLALHLQLAADTDGGAFSWIVPVPKGSTAPTVALGDAALFAALDQLTTPTITIAQGGSGGGGFCGSDSKAAGAGQEPRGGVQHFGGADLGPYTYDIVAGSDADALGQWLTGNDYLLPEGFAAAIAPYTEKSVFIAVRLSPGASADGATLRPLAITWARQFGEGLGYALGLSKLSTAAEQPLLLWVLADKRQRVANFGSSELRVVAEAMADRGLDYEAMLGELTAEAGGRLMVTEFAKDLRALEVPSALASLISDESFYLTRLFAVVPEAALEDLVITFAANAPDVEPAVTVSHGESTAPVLASVLLLLWRRRSVVRL